MFDVPASILISTNDSFVKIYKSNLLQLALLVGLMTGCATQPLASLEKSRRAAASWVVGHHVSNSPDREMMTVFSSLHPVAAGTEVSPAQHRGDPAQPPPIHSTGKESWFFVIDHATPAAFAHRLTYVFVPLDGSPPLEFEEMWWPKITGKSLWFSRGMMTAPSQYIVYEGIVATAWRLNHPSP